MNIGFDGKRIFHNQTGLGNYSRDSVRILANHYPEHNYFIFNPKPSEKSFLANQANVKEINPTSFIYKKFKSIWRTSRISKDAEKLKLDIYHGLSNELPVGIHKVCKSIVTIHDLIFLRFPHLYPWIDRLLYKIKFKYACKNAHHIIAISEQSKNDIMRFFNIEEEKISVIYQGCHPIFQSQVNEELKKVVAEKFTLPDKFILNVGTIEERKNLLSLVKALKQIDEIPLVIVGKEREYARQVFDYVKKEQLQDRIIHLKQVSIEELAAIYQLSKMFIYPSIFEGFGIPIIEALFSKVPVVSSLGSCFSEAGGPSSRYVPHDSPAAIAEAINSILYDDELAKQMTEKGWQYAQRFTDGVIADQIMHLYEAQSYKGT